MSGKLDEISRVIGNQEANLASLTKTFERHCSDDDDRHKENVTRLDTISDNIASLTAQLAPLIKTVGVMQPIVEGYQISRWKVAGALSAAGFIFYGIVWVISNFALKFIAWMIAR